MQWLHIYLRHLICCLLIVTRVTILNCNWAYFIYLNVSFIEIRHVSIVNCECGCLIVFTFFYKEKERNFTHFCKSWIIELHECIIHVNAQQFIYILYRVLSSFTFFRYSCCSFHSFKDEIFKRGAIFDTSISANKKVKSRFYEIPLNIDSNVCI